MVFLSPKLPRAQLQHQVLAPRDTDDDHGWGTMQISAPIMVGVILIVLFSAYIIWHKWTSHSFRPAHLFNRVRDACVATFAQVFMPEHRRRRVQHVSTSVTLDDSMITPRHIGRQSYARSDSTDSQTPLTDNLEFYYPPHKRAVQPLGREAPHQPERRTWRWLRFLRFGPREVQSQVPNHRFRVEGPDESSVGHGDASLHSPNVAARSGWTSGLPSLPERDEGDPNRGYYDRVIQIGDPDTAQSTPMTPVHYEGVAEVIVTPPSAPPSVRTPAPDYSSAVEYPFMPVTSNLQTMATAPTTVIPQNPHYTPEPKRSRLPAPPLYSSISRSSHPSAESIIHPARSDPMSLYPGSMRVVARSTPQHIYQAHERQMSTESVLVSSKPMVTHGIY